jgi:hypothetical protein
MGATKISGISKRAIANQVFSHAAELVDDMLTIVYTHAEKESTIDSNNHKVVKLDELRKIMEIAINMTYDKLKSI